MWSKSHLAIKDAHGGARGLIGIVASPVSITPRSRPDQMMSANGTFSAVRDFRASKAVGGRTAWTMRAAVRG